MSELNPRIPYLREKANGLPLLAGVYLMKDKSGKIIYVGKAKRLKNRVVTYFRSQKDMLPKVRKMVSQVDDFDYIICESEYEALVLECSQIKLYKPKYNILLKDDKGYSYLKYTDGDWPRLSVEFRKDSSGAKFFGPYYSHFVIKNALEAATKIYRLPECSLSFPKDIGKCRPCLNYHIGRCSAPCGGKISQAEFKKNAEDALEFIKNGAKETQKELTALMEDAAKRLDFEAAAKYRDKLKILNSSTQKQKVVACSNKEQDVIALAFYENKMAFAVLEFKNYALCDYRHFLIDNEEDKEEARAEFIKRFYATHRAPPFIFADGEVKDRELIEKMLSQMAERKVQIVLPKIGEKDRLINMAKLNASEYLAKSIGKKTAATAALSELASLLGLSKPPKIIESYDISHTGGENAVGGMVVFCEGVPSKKDYRKFIIKSAVGGDDYAATAEVLSRRLAEYEKHKDDTVKEGFARLPDLILLDGGKGQLSAVLPLCKRYGIPVFGMVKDSRHKTRAIVGESGETALKQTRSAYNLVYSLQEEVHRFAITFHRSKSGKKSIHSELLEIEGVGEGRAKALLKHFKSLSAIKNATVEQLCEVVPRTV
ncbi:MAG: excinuclease ABC subunit UvrC, partial [Oscillospiraceae bacterium]|nr:excinuclease ABC subunit UvrC [Candidatus Equicaccousia limihippi]